MARKKTVSSYDKLKEFGGKKYTGMAVGRGHKWNYDAGEWSEKKATPDRWEFTYSVVKRRKGKAPEGSGAPVGTAHHWLIVADQVVEKQDANSYTTEMKGAKFKVAHRRAGATSWTGSEAARRKQAVKFLREMIDELEKPGEEPVDELAAVRAAKRSTKPVKKAVAAKRTTRKQPAPRKKR